MLLVASCVFYGFWDWRFLFLMFSSITVDYLCARKIQASDEPGIRKRFLLLSIVVNLSILGFFKYFNFFTHSFQSLLNNLGFHLHLRVLNIILPIGISFYTFEAMSYVIDVYKKKMAPARNYLDYTLFVTYFPHLIAGPIMRAKDLLPQITSPRVVTVRGFFDGCYIFFWGLFQKVFVADNLARLVDPVFDSPGPHHGLQVILAIYAFAFQIYCDFAGYSNMARGLGRCMGFNIMVNFNFPYIAKNPREFWQRWHISLSTWLRDYLYVPLGGNQHGTVSTYRNLLITMLFGGLWHGAAWTFVAWGAYHGFLLIVHRTLAPLFSRMAGRSRIFATKTWQAIKVLFFFHLVCFGWFLFRAASISQAYRMLRDAIFNTHIVHGLGVKVLIFFVFPLIVIEAFQYVKKDFMIVLRWPVPVRTFIYVMIFYSIVIFGVHNAQNFIYFQF